MSKIEPSEQEAQNVWETIRTVLKTNWRAELDGNRIYFFFTNKWKTEYFATYTVREQYSTGLYYRSSKKSKPKLFGKVSAAYWKHAPKDKVCKKTDTILDHLGKCADSFEAMKESEKNKRNRGKNRLVFINSLDKNLMSVIDGHGVEVMPSEDNEIRIKADVRLSPENARKLLGILKEKL